MRVVLKWDSVLDISVTLVFLTWLFSDELIGNEEDEWFLSEFMIWTHPHISKLNKDSYKSNYFKRKGKEKVM